MSIETAMSNITAWLDQEPFVLHYHKEVDAFCEKHDIKVDDLLDITNYPDGCEVTIMVDELQYVGDMVLWSELIDGIIKIRINYNPPRQRIATPPSIHGRY